MIKKTLLTLISFAFISCVLGVILLGLSAKQLHQPFAQKTTLNVANGSSIYQVANQLQKLNLTESPRFYALYARFTGEATKIKAGEYAIEQDDSLISLLDDMVAGKVIQYPVSIIEGSTFKELRSALAANENLTYDSAGLTDAEIMTRLNRSGQHPEGRFFADTYNVTKGTSDLELLKLAAKRMDKVLAEEWGAKQAGLPYDNEYEALIMASIVEKETALPKERPDIAGVFVRRLRKKMRLQTDPTIIYGLGDEYKGDIKRKHLRQPTAYNTYVIPALPPTPIAMVGRESIHAALNPSDGETLYFVATGDGGHYFSSTLEEHNKAVYKYQIAPHKRAKQKK